jgi:hypothetical protein
VAKIGHDLRRNAILSCGVHLRRRRRRNIIVAVLVTVPTPALRAYPYNIIISFTIKRIYYVQPRPRCVRKTHRYPTLQQRTMSVRPYIYIYNDTCARTTRGLHREFQL